MVLVKVSGLATRGQAKAGVYILENTLGEGGISAKVIWEKYEMEKTKRGEIYKKKEERGIKRRHGRQEGKIDAK